MNKGFQTSKQRTPFFSKPEGYVTLSGAFFFGWILVIPFEGQIFRGLMELQGKTNSAFMAAIIGVHLLGLLLSGVMIRSVPRAWQVMITATLICLMFNGSILMAGRLVWAWAFLAVAFFSGTFVAAWGAFLKNCVAADRRYVTVVDVLILSNLLMMIIDMAAVNWQLKAAKLLAFILAAASVWLVYRLRDFSKEAVPLESDAAALAVQENAMQRPFAWLCLFIVIITLNSGLMYQVVTPTYVHLPLLTSFYWAIPYMAVLVVLRRLPRQANQAHTLFLALAAMGLGYLFFRIMPANMTGFIVVNTLMMGALGIFDLFWWSLMVSFIGITRRPAAVLGLGLSANVLGILLGGHVGGAIQQTLLEPGEITLVAFGVIFIGLGLLPRVNRELSKLFSHHTFLYQTQQPEVQAVARPEAADAAAVTENTHNSPPVTGISLDSVQTQYQLTDREMMILGYLRQGDTYRRMAQHLGITEHTVKYHARNIYQKLRVKNKLELIQKLTGLSGESEARGEPGEQSE